MKKWLLFALPALLFTACNNKSSDKPDAERVITDTVAQALPGVFTSNSGIAQMNVSAAVKEDETPRVQGADINTLLSRLKSPAQRFIIDAGKDAEITGEQGTVIGFTANSFVDKKGKTVAELIDVELKEVYSVPQMVKENVSNNTQKLLDSKGSICITAFYQGEELSLKKGETISVDFPFALGAKDNYQFYYGSKEGDSQTLAEADKTGSGGKGKGIVLPKFEHKNMDLKTYMRQYVSYPEDARRNELSSKVEATFKIDKKGRISDIQVNSTYKTFKDEVSQVLATMPAWQPAQFNGKNIVSGMKLTIDFNLRRKEQVSVETNDNEVLFYNTVGKNKQRVFNLRNAHLQQVYSRTFAKLGWINCDRSVYENLAKADIIVRSDANTDVKVVLINNNTVVSGKNFVGYTRFKNLPLNSEVMVLTMRNVNGEISYALQPLRLQKQNIITPTWKKGSVEELNRVFERLKS
ncbi:MAG: energy transducer TonB [Bacteroidetes bacterium]|nr:energy transducer TonB [Bacteroidota bacterium]